MALGRLTSFTFGNSFLTLVYANSQTYYVSYAHIIAGESDSRSGDLTIWIYTAGEVGETLSVKNSDLVAIGSSATAFLALFNQNIQPYSYWQDFLDSTTASGALPSEPSALRGQCLYARFRPIYNFGSASLINVPARFKAGTLYSQVPDTGAGDFTVTRATTPVGGRSTRINKDGLIELVADNAPRLDYPLGGAVNGCPALLVEPSATNSIRNNSMVNAVAGTPGALPTNWFTLTTGLTRTIVGTGTENGVQYIDIRFSGTSTATTYSFGMELPSIIAATSSQAWSNSIFFKVVSAPSPPTSYQLQTIYVNSGAYVSETNSTLIATTTLTRYSFAHTSPASTITNVYPVFRANFLNGQSYDFTIRIGYPQMELGSVATSVIPTTTAAVTRSAEVISDTTATALIGQSEGTIYAEVDVARFTQNAIVSISDGTINNRIEIGFQSTTQLYAIVSVLGASNNFIATIPAVPSTGGVYKIALAYKANDYCFAINSTTVASAASRGVPSCNKVNLGSIFNNTLQLNDRIRAAAICPTRLTNAELAALTAP